MKKALILAFCFIILTGCGKAPEITPPPSEEPVEEAFKFTEDNFPRVDGSTATIPLIEAVTSALLNKPRADINVTVSKTSGAYVALAKDEADILLVYDGGEDMLDQINAVLRNAASNTDIADPNVPPEIPELDDYFETVPIGKDALVFVVNRDNPVDNLTTEQVQKIFSGEYTNWSELGGSSEPIRAYQRGIGSGSQALMDKLVMDGLTMADPVRIPVIGDMGGLIDAVASFSGEPSGIGYNVYFYVTEMRENDYIKILSVDGVEPTYDSIQSGAYPFVSEFYSVIRRAESEGSPARRLHEWMLTDEAQNLMASENYVALHANPNADTPYVEGEFSHYPEGEAPKYFEGVNYYLLKAREDYGQLYFYLGTTRYDDFGYPCFYGLCTGSGEIVTKPIYSVPRLLIDSAGNKAYVCYHSGNAPVVETIDDNGWIYERNIYPVLLFATDGSWVEEFDGAMTFYSFTGATEAAMNADVLAVMRDGKWGAVNMMGETVIPFERDSSDDIYGAPKNDYQRPFFGVTGDRFMWSETEDVRGVTFGLYDKNLKLIATGLRGVPVPGCGEYIITSGWWGEDRAIRTYTLDGVLIGELAEYNSEIWGAAAFGDYVLVYAEKSTLICDRALKVLYEYENEYVEKYDYYTVPFSFEAGVLYRSDGETLLHRTYLPDGTRLVTWYDPEMSVY